MRVARSERWAWIPGYENRYKVSTLGNVLSMPTGRRTYSKLLKPFLFRGQYRRVRLCSDNGVIKNAFIGRLVLLTFVGPCPEGMVMCHGSKGSTDDSLTNLRWATQKDNIADKYAHGTVLIGAKNHNTILTIEQVLDIRRREARGETGVALAREYNVDVTTISNIVVRKTWRHI